MKKLNKCTLLLAVSLTALLSAGCSDKVRMRSEYECAKDVVQTKADFTLKCLSNANPKSDEEPEDWILYCEDMAKRNFCAEVKYRTVYAWNWSFISREKISR